MFMLFAASIDDVATVETSGISQYNGTDFDVGIQVSESNPPALTVYQFNKAFDTCAVPVASMKKEAIHARAITPAYTATTCASMNECAVMPRQMKQPCNYWRGGDTKASLCEAVVNIPIQYPCYFDSQPYAFGRDIRRLSFEAKA